MRIICTTTYFWEFRKKTKSRNHSYTIKNSNDETMATIRPITIGETNFNSDIYWLVTRKKLKDNPELKHDMVLTVIKAQQILEPKPLKLALKYFNWVEAMQEKIDALH